MMFSSLILSASMPLAPPAVSLPEALDASSFRDYVEYLQPNDEEMCWNEIPWRHTFQQGVVDSQIEGKPILLWAMNGHPLGCV